MVDMGDDGEIADFGQISHEWGYDLDSAIGQAGTSLVRHSFWEELRSFSSLERPKQASVACRAILRSVALLGRRKSLFSFNEGDLLKILRLASNGIASEWSNSASDSYFNLEIFDEEIWIEALFGADRVLIRHTKDWHSYDLYVGHPNGSDSRLGTRFQNDFKSRHLPSFDRGNLYLDIKAAENADSFSTPFQTPLWLENTLPIQERIETLQSFFTSDLSIWSYWRDWYQGFLDGKPLDWELQRRVALIDDSIWEAGPEAVAKEIERIQAQMLAEKLPMAEHIEVNPDTGKFRAIPIPVENPTTLFALLSQIEDALEDCLGGHNGLAERSGTVKKLNRVLTKYKDDPQNAELTLTRVAGSLHSQLHETRELPDNEDNLALLDAVEEGVRGIRANHPEIAKNREQLAQQAIHALTPEDKELLQQALPVLAAISEPELAEDFEADIPELINDALLPLPNGAPPLPGADATTRVFSRVSKMALLVQKGKDLTKQGAQAFDSDLAKSIRLAGLTISVAGGVGGFLYAVVQVGLRVLGVL